MLAASSRKHIASAGRLGSGPALGPQRGQRFTFPSPVSIDSSTKLEPVCLVGEKFR